MNRLLLAALCPMVLVAQTVPADERRGARAVYFRNVKKLTSFTPDGKKLLWVRGRSPRGARHFDACAAEWPS
jgi:hypothetical protein